MSAAHDGPAPFGRAEGDEPVGRTPEDADAVVDPGEQAFLDSLPGRLRRVAARQELTRDALPRRGDSLEDPQLSAATQRVWDTEKSTARCLAEQYRALAELYELDGTYEESTELDEVETLRAGLALRVTRSAAGWKLRDAYQAVHLFPRALARLEGGEMPSAWFERMLKTSRSLQDSSRRQLDLAISTWSMDIGAERFFTLLKALIEHLADREDRPDPTASLERSVSLLPGPQSGTGLLQITGPIPEILSRWKRLDESARAVQAAQRAALRDGTPIPHDPDGTVQETGRTRPLHQLRYALMDTAELDLDGVVVPTERFRLNVTVPVLTLLGAADEPGTLDGTIPLPPSMARSLAGSSETWYRVLTAPRSGAFLPLPADRYQPTAAMLEHLRLRGGQCAVPGCTRPSGWASECDHIEECLRGSDGEGGLTEIENLHLLCWQHHLDKTAGLLDPTRISTSVLEPGRTRWTIGTQGDAVTVIDDLDTASIRMVEDLSRAWTSFLRGKHAGSPLTTPAATPGALPAEPTTVTSGGEPPPPSPAGSPPRRIIPRPPHPSSPRDTGPPRSQPTASPPTRPVAPSPRPRRSPSPSRPAEPPPPHARGQMPLPPETSSPPPTRAEGQPPPGHRGRREGLGPAADRGDLGPPPF